MYSIVNDLRLFTYQHKRMFTTPTPFTMHGSQINFNLTIRYHDYGCLLLKGLLQESFPRKRSIAKFRNRADNQLSYNCQLALLSTYSCTAGLVWIFGVAIKCLCVNIAVRHAQCEYCTDNLLLITGWRCNGLGYAVVKISCFQWFHQASVTH